MFWHSSLPETIVSDADSAASEAAKIGFPVVLKACGTHLTHKTEAGGVVLNLRGKGEVKKEATSLKINGCEGLLVQEWYWVTRTCLWLDKGFQLVHASCSVLEGCSPKFLKMLSSELLL